MLGNPGSSKVKKSRSKHTKDIANNTRLHSFGFTTSTTKTPVPKTVVGISTKLESLGIKKPAKKVENCTDKDIDHSLYLWPNYLFPELDEPGVSVADLGLELVGIEYDARDIIMDLKQCYIEVICVLTIKDHS